MTAQPYGSLRNWRKPPEPPPRLSLESTIDRIMSQPQHTAPPEGNTPVTPDAIRDIHTRKDLENRIASLKRDGVEQLASIENMTPSAIVEAQRQGRLLAMLAGIPVTSGED